MPYSAKAVANEFIKLACGEDLSPMKLQKLVYFAHGWYLAQDDRPLVREDFQAWQFGPVIPDLYHAFKNFGAGNVTEFASTHDFRNGGGRIVPTMDDEGSREENTRAKDLVQQVWNIYKGYSATRLSNATHMAGTPWSQVYNSSGWATPIPDALIQSYFRTLTNAGV